MTTLERVKTDAPAVPSWLRGAWRRELLRVAGGAEDRTTDVLWVQTESLFADIRIPAERPELRGRRGVEDCTPAELIAVAATKAFAGWTTFDDGICRWSRPIDFRPPTGQVDAGRMELRENSLWEHGLAGEYAEEYRRAADGGRRMAAWSLESDSASSPPGVLVIIDDYVIRAIGRREPLSIGTDLASLITVRSGDLPALKRLFECEVSLALTTDLVIRRSTIPWWEDRRLTMPNAFSAGTGEDLLLENYEAGRRRWRRCNTGPDGRTMASLLNG